MDFDDGNTLDNPHWRGDDVDAPHLVDAAHPQDAAHPNHAAYLDDDDDNYDLDNLYWPGCEVDATSLYNAALLDDAADPNDATDLNFSDLDEDDFLDLDPGSQLIEDLTFKLVHIDAPDWYINPDFRVVFQERSAYDSIAASSPLSFAPNLHENLASSMTPRLIFFKTLPKGDGSLWAIYLLVFEKAGCPTKVYVGSGTDAKKGVLSRLAQYFPGSTVLPRFVRQAFEQGYHIAHHGLLCWTPLPRPGLVPRVRARFLALEALFTALFHAAIPAITDMYFAHLLLWERITAEWEPLCSHLPLSEGVRGDLAMSAEELEIVAAARVFQRNKKHQEVRAKQSAKDPEAYRLRENRTKNAWNENHRDRANKNARRTQHKAKSLRRFYCNICDMPFESQGLLDRHLDTLGHADRVRGIPMGTLSQYQLNGKKALHDAKISRKHYCSICDFAFQCDNALNKHKRTKRHLAKLAKAENA